ncbi:MAG: hypothetical protein WC373_14010 [Smithella sp.]|jgi:hypothetical protein
MKLKNLTNKNIWTNRTLWVVIIIVVFVCLYKPPIVETIGKLFRHTFSAAINFQSFQSNLKTPHAGEQVLPSAVQEMLSFLRANHLESYQISEEIKTHKYILIRQRIAESAWPARINPKSNDRFILITELDDYPDCEIKGLGKEAALVFCR